MLLETQIYKAVSYLVSSIKRSKGSEQANDEISTIIWDWVNPLFLKEGKEDEVLSDLRTEPDDQLNQDAVVIVIKKHLKNSPDAAASLVKLLEELQDKVEKTPEINQRQAHFGSGDNIAGAKVIKGPHGGEGGLDD